MVRLIVIVIGSKLWWEQLAGHHIQIKVPGCSGLNEKHFILQAWFSDQMQRVLGEEPTGRSTY